VVAQELCRVQHAREQTPHPMAAHQREQPTVSPAGLVPPGDQAGQRRPVLEDPFQALPEGGHGFPQVGLDRLHREEGDETD
jgi:hypothetical protein